MIITIFTDGGSRGNPGEGAVGVIIKFKYQISNIKTEEKITKISKRIGRVTNNEAEYMAVIEALMAIKNEQLLINNKQDKIEEVRFFLDSSLVVNQLKGLFKIKEPRMREFITKIRELEGELGIYPTFTLIPREQNKEADKLVNQALDGQIIG